MPEVPHQRRPRYRGKNPRAFEEKYKEHLGDPATLEKVLAAGKTPAGAHRPILLEEVLEILHPCPGERFADCTLGFGGHAEALLHRLQPGGALLGLDVDALEQPKTKARLRAAGFGPETLLLRQSNYAGLAKILGALGWPGVDGILADLGLSSMQIDDPKRGFSVKASGPLDMRMNPARGQTAAQFLEKTDAAALEIVLRENSDEPQASTLAAALAGRLFSSTSELRAAVEAAFLPRRNEEASTAVRRFFQAIRIEVNDEFSALETFLRNLPFCLRAGGRVAILTFHSGEDRRVKRALKAGLEHGFYSRISSEVIRATAREQFENPRSIPAKLRWAIKGVKFS